MRATSPGRKARHTCSTAARSPCSTRSVACGQVASVVGTSRASAARALVPTRTGAGIRRADHRVQTAATVTTRMTTVGRAMTSRRSAQGWSGVMPGRYQVSTDEPSATSSAPVQDGRSRSPVHAWSALWARTAEATSASTSATGPSHQDIQTSDCSA